MALEGNLKDFSATEILQLLGTQKKTGCLLLEREGDHACFYVLDGRMVSSRVPGLAKDDPLLRFLLRIRRLSNEQYRGIITIQRESNRDLEDLLVNGRYLDGEELGGLIERQILDDLMRVMSWEDGSYRFDAHQRWPNPPLARLSVEAALMEAARRADEQRRYAKLSGDPHQLAGVRDLPDTEEQLSEEECELFGIIDGRHTLAEIVEAAPLTDYEAYEALQRMVESGWVEIVGRRDPGVAAASAAVIELPAEGGTARPARPPWTLEIAVACGVVLLAVALVLAAGRMAAPSTTPASGDGFASARTRNLVFALELYRRERGRYPEQLEALVDDRWVRAGEIRNAGRPVPYACATDGQSFTLDALPRR